MGVKCSLKISVWTPPATLFLIILAQTLNHFIFMFCFLFMCSSTDRSEPCSEVNACGGVCSAVPVCLMSSMQPFGVQGMKQSFRSPRDNFPAFMQLKLDTNKNNFRDLEHRKYVRHKNVFQLRISKSPTMGHKISNISTKIREKVTHLRPYPERRRW